MLVFSRIIHYGGHAIVSLIEMQLMRFRAMLFNSKRLICNVPSTRVQSVSFPTKTMRQKLCPAFQHIHTMPAAARPANARRQTLEPTRCYTNHLLTDEDRECHQHTTYANIGTQALADPR